MSERGYWDKVLNRRVSRRRAIAAAGALTASTAFLAACGGDDDDDGGGDTGSGGGGGSPTTGSGGSGPTTSGQPKSGGVARMNTLTAVDPATYDLHQAADANSTWIASMAYDQLVQFSTTEKDVIAPNLASAWEHPDPTTVTFTLHEASFHDGSPFTSADVKATMDRIQNPPEGVVSIRRQQFTHVDSIETPDDRTVVFKLSRPSAAIFGSLAQTNLGIYSQKDLGGPDPNWHIENINGTGPFTLDQVNQGSLYTMKKNPSYFEEGLPRLDGWEWHIIPEEVARFAAFASGNLDLHTVDTPNLEAVRNNSEMTLLETSGTAYWVTTLPAFRDPWKDDRTWKAIALAADKHAFNVANFQGTSTHGGPLPPGSKWALTDEELLQVPGYKGLGDGQESDMDARWAEARKLLDAASFPASMDIELFGLSGSPAFENWAIVLADGVKHIGLNANITLHERGVYDERLAARDFGDLAANSRSAVFPDPTPVFADSYLEGAGRHYTGIVIPEVEDLFVKQESELDSEKRFALQNEMQKAFLKVYPAEISVFTVTRQGMYNYVKEYGEAYGSFYQGRKYQYVWLDT
jgi:peptide/nickel transport system substrate-binding protein